MPSFEHEKLVNKLNSLNEVPADQDEFSKWISASEHLSFLKGNAVSDELIIYAGGGHNFIHADIISNEALEAASEIQLLDWSGTPYRSIASYVSGMGRGEIWLESYQDIASFPKDSKGIFAKKNGVTKKNGVKKNGVTRKTVSSLAFCFSSGRKTVSSLAFCFSSGLR